MREVTALELLLLHADSLSHVLQQVLLYLDPTSLRSLKAASSDTRDIVDALVWNNSTGAREMHRKLISR